MFGKRLGILSSQLLRAAAPLVVAMWLSMAVAQAQTFTVLHSFSGGGDGANPLAGLAIDHAGNLYGTTSIGGVGNGAVFKLANRNSSWILSPLYQFRGVPDGFYPQAGVTIAADGTLYGTTFYGGIAGANCDQYGPLQCGTVFHLRPSATACTTAICYWTETQIYEFNTEPSLFWPNFGEVIFDSSGNIYGAANQGGTGAGGGAYELTNSSGSWTETTLYNFGGGGLQPMGGVIFDSVGDLYGTTYGEPWEPHSPVAYGTVYELTPSGGQWTEHTLYTFQDGNDGALPRSSLIMDAAGNLYGTSSVGGSSGFGTAGGGTVWELSPSDGSWTFTVLYTFPGPGKGPFSPLLMDTTGNLYGTTLGGGAYQQGSVFKLTPSGGGWTYTTLHDFTGGNDGRSPYGHLIFDSNGNLYGTAGWGGSDGGGVVWQIAP